MTPARARLAQLLQRASALIGEPAPMKRPPYWPAPPAIKSVVGYVQDYEVEVSRLVADVLNGDIDARAMGNGLRRLVRDYAEATFIEGMLSGGDFADEQEARDALEDKDENTIEGWKQVQREAASGYAQDVAAVRKDPDYPNNKAAQQRVFERVKAWGLALRNLGDLGRLSGLGNVPLLFDGDDGEESCVECQRYKGQVHRRSWWEARGLITRNGNPNFSCGRWEPCHHSFYAVVNGKRGDLVVK